MPREDTQAARKPVTRLSGAGLRDAHLRTSVREDLTPTGMVEAEKRETANAGEDDTLEALTPHAGGEQAVQLLSETGW